MFAGSLMFSQLNLFDMAVGGWMCFVGFTAVVVGQHTANKLTDLKKTLGSESVVKAKFKAMDRDGSGTLDSSELAALCKVSEERSDEFRSGFMRVFLMRSIQPCMQFALLMQELGSELDHNELVAALDTMDKDSSGSISYEEFFGWWSGWSHEKESVSGMASV